MSYLGRDKIREIKDTDKNTPLGSPVKEVVFYTDLELLHDEIDRVREERVGATDPVEIERLDKQVEEIEGQQSTTKDTVKTIYMSATAIEQGRTDAPSDEYYHKRKVAIVGGLLEYLAEWAVQDVEVGPIFQWLEQSLIENRDRAIGARFAKPKQDLNLLDYHYAILDRADRSVNS